MAHSVMQGIAKYGFKIVAIQIIMWQKTGSLEINSHIIFYEKCDDRWQFGTDLIVHNSLISAIIECKSINSRILM